MRLAGASQSLSPSHPKLLKPRPDIRYDGRMSSTDSQACLPGYDEALARVLAHVPPLGSCTAPLMQALGRVLREAVKTDRDQPPFHRSAMDGFAVIGSRIQAGTWYDVTGGVAAGGRLLGEGEGRSGVIRIATGAPVFGPFDAVIPIEQAQVMKEGGSERVRFHEAVFKPGQHIHRQAADAKRDDVVLAAGTLIGPQHIGIAAAVGATRLTVAQQPRITLLTTGDEVVDPATTTDRLGPQQIRNSNGPMLAAFFAALGTPLLEHAHVGDDPEQTRAAAREALSHSHLVITNGGISAGQRDWLPWAWSKLGLGTIIKGVAIQPGRPVLVCGDGTISDLLGISDFGFEGMKGTGARSASCKSEIRNPKSQFPSKLVLGLPGNPVSVLATAHLFAWPVVRRMLMGDADGAALPWRRVTLAQPVKATSKREVFRAARMQRDGGASVIHWQGSGDLIHTATADGFVRLPRTDEPIEAGTTVDFLPLVR